MKTQHPIKRNGFKFHGGCTNCTNELHICPGCRYMETDWNLPDLNPISIKQQREVENMVVAAHIAKAIFDIKEVQS